MRQSLSANEARRTALAAQGFGGPRKLSSRNPFDAALDRLHILQIDSVSVFARSHYLPIFSRHGAYDTPELDAQLWQSGSHTEYWAHEAAFIRVADRPLFTWRMRDFHDKHRLSGKYDQFANALDEVRSRLLTDGPQFVRELEEAPRTGRGPWWDWSDTKQAVEMLFANGEVVSAGRQGFQRRYALAEQVLPDHALIEVPRSEAQAALVAAASRSLGVATLADLADYHRLRLSEARTAVRSLEDEGVLVPVTVAGWLDKTGESEPAWLHRDARVPSRLAPDALLTPFDPVVWFRPRAERMFDFHYRLEIYTPAAKRKYGYYCLPLMVGGKLVGRIDLKADRSTQTLLVQAAWQEPGAPARTAECAARLIAEAAAWQGLTTVRAFGRGNLPLPLEFHAAVH